MQRIAHADHAALWPRLGSEGPLGIGVAQGAQQPEWPYPRHLGARARGERLAESAYDVHEPELRQAGFCAFLPKPVHPAFLAHAVRVCIDAAGKGIPWVRVGPIEASH